ncbi:2773_t:CDS:1, partial [Cetraspora pellucida]
TPTGTSVESGPNTRNRPDTVATARSPLGRPPRNRYDVREVAQDLLLAPSVQPHTAIREVLCTMPKTKEKKIQ